MRQFSSALAHELRTPLAALRGEIELALLQVAIRARMAAERGQPDRGNRQADASGQSAADAGARRVRARFRWRASRSIWRPWPRPSPSSSSRSRRPRTSRCSAPSPAGHVTGDSGWLERLLLNLLDNAIKYTPPGGEYPRQRVARERPTPGSTSATPASAFPPTRFPIIFERFYRVDPSRSSKAEGAGLGLSLAKWIVDRHHGRIEVTSAPGHGATFAVQLPARNPLAS